MKNPTIIRQGDCMLVKIDKLPACLTEVHPKNGRLELLWGEVTTHCHAISDWAGAAEIAKNAIGLAGRRARLLLSSDGTQYLEVAETVHLRHEEHTAHAIPPGIYEMPIQVSWDAEHGARQVAD